VLPGSHLRCLGPQLSTGTRPDELLTLVRLLARRDLRRLPSLALRGRLPGELGCPLLVLRGPLLGLANARDRGIPLAPQLLEPPLKLHQPRLERPQPLHLLNQLRPRRLSLVTLTLDLFQPLPQRRELVDSARKLAPGRLCSLQRD